jgi:hypothetical protein
MTTGWSRFPASAFADGARSYSTSRQRRSSIRFVVDSAGVARGKSLLVEI